jgi:hypothetical protein
VENPHHGEESLHGISQVSAGSERWGCLKKDYKIERRLHAAFVIAEICDRALQRPNVFCLPTLIAFGHSDFNRLAFFKAAIAIALDCREMNEYIFTALSGYKAEALSGVEPLNSSLFHFVYCPDVNLTLENRMFQQVQKRSSLQNLNF